MWLGDKHEFDSPLLAFCLFFFLLAVALSFPLPPFGRPSSTSRHHAKLRGPCLPVHGLVQDEELIIVVDDSRQPDIGVYLQL